MQITPAPAATVTDHNRVEHWVEKGLHASAYRNGKDVTLKVTQFFATVGERDAFAAQFPKGNKVGSSTMSIYDGGRQDTVPLVSVTFQFSSNNVTGDRNESAIKRFRSFEKNLAKAGLVVNWTDPWANSVDYAEVEAHIA